MPVHEEDTTGSLYSVLKHLSADALLKALDLLENDNAKYLPREDRRATPSRPRSVPIRENRISAGRVVNSPGQCRAFAPRPGAYFEHGGERIKVGKARLNYTPKPLPAGSIYPVKKTIRESSCRDGCTSCRQELPVPGTKNGRR
ncbi:MAG: hypothetical protein U5N56_12550 [Candidatus Marinimicrobia bacterium]|nr:hypothetical protein [Candidatus Neomarinimicrobiota bacterium]